MPLYPWKNDQFKYMPISTVVDIWERAGYVYEASADIPLSSNGVNQTIFICGERPVVFFSRIVSYNGVGVNLDIFRNPEFDDDGTPIEYYNSNDINPQPNYGVEGGDRLVSGASVTNTGIKSRATRYVYGGDGNQNSGAPVQAIDAPQLVRPNEAVNFVVTNRDTNSTQNFASTIRWASPPNIEDYVFDETGTFIKYKGPIPQIT